MRTVLVLAQALGAVAVLLGVALWLPLYAALVVDGLLVLVLATAAEIVAQRRPGAPSSGRSGSRTEVA